VGKKRFRLEIHRNGAKLIKSYDFVKRLKAFENIFAAVCQNILLPLKKNRQYHGTAAL
jgi:hypothetical protein